PGSRQFASEDAPLGSGARPSESARGGLARQPRIKALTFRLSPHHHVKRGYQEFRPALVPSPPTWDHEPTWASGGEKTMKEVSKQKACFAKLAGFVFPLSFTSS